MRRIYYPIAAVFGGIAIVLSISVLHGFKFVFAPTNFISGHLDTVYIDKDSFTIVKLLNHKQLYNYSLSLLTSEKHYQVFKLKRNTLISMTYSQDRNIRTIKADDQIVLDVVVLDQLIVTLLVLVLDFIVIYMTLKLFKMSARVDL